MPHFSRVDYRSTSLSFIIKGLSESINFLHTQLNTIDYYDADWLLEETEPIYGLALIAFQNYINGSINDFAGSLKNKELFYSIEKEPLTNSKSRIELIVALANYSKHKDEGIPHRGTRETLESFDINYNETSFPDESPIFQGITQLNNNWDLYKIENYVIEWRELLWYQINK